ncbi:MAG: hypothetical protein JNK21_04230 [Rhodospirillaceae bacterium]|nr:hypothetical protein [Rhodospirillaceae bacterium]
MISISRGLIILLVGSLALGFALGRSDVGALVFDLFRYPIDLLEPVSADSQSDDHDLRAKNDVAAQWEMARWARVLGILTFFQVIIGVGGIVFIVKSFTDGRRATDAAQASVTVAQQNARRELRAYLEVKAGEFLIDKHNKKFKMSFIIKNGGATPAYNVRFDTAIKFRLKSTTAPIDRTILSPTNAETSLMKERELVTRVAYENFTEALERLIHECGSILVAYGVVYYEDVFDVKHWIEFQYKINSWALHNKKAFVSMEGNVTDKDGEPLII